MTDDQAVTEGRGVGRAALVFPNTWGFGQQPMRTRTLEMLQLLPITPEEEQYCGDHGHSGILGALNTPPVRTVRPQPRVDRA